MSFEPIYLDASCTYGPFQDIVAGMTHILVLGKKGIVYGQGGNMREQLGEGGQTKTDGIPTGLYESYGNSILKLKQFGLPEAITSIGAGKYHSVFLSCIIFCLRV